MSKLPETNRLSISVALCTYNGQRFLEEQLHSIAAQDRPPDELVVCDDGSSDQSAMIVERFAARAPFPVRLEVNASNVGCGANYARAISRCRGELIALADQDDAWLPGKLRRLAAALESDPGAAFAFSDARIVDDSRRPLGYSLWQAIRFSRREQRLWRCGRALDVLLRHNVVSGTTLVLRATSREALLPIPAGWVHDGWLALVAAALWHGVAIAEPLVEYRQHSGQQIGEKRRSLYEQYLRSRQRGRDDFRRIAANYRAARERLARLGGERRAAVVLAALDEKIAHFEAKARMRSGGGWRLPLIVRECLHRHYARYSSGWRSLAQDLFA